MDTVEKPKFNIHRSGLFIASYQLEGVCIGLRLTIPQGQAPGKGTIDILHKIFAEVSKLTRGIDKDFPEISENSNSVDILIFAETLRTSVLAFLTPEEFSEHKKMIGFQNEGQ